MSAGPDPALVEALAARALARRAPGRMRVVGIGGPQGSGKSTLAAALAERLDAEGLRTATLSLDDLYLTRDERLALAARTHPLFAVRGPPGTHDVALGLRTLDALARPGETTPLRFDKATDERRPPGADDRVEGPVDIVLFEGWCLGARPAEPGEPDAPLNALERDDDAGGGWRRAVEAALAADYPALWARIDLFVWLQPPDFETVLTWRIGQEHALRERLARTGEAGRAMDDAEVARFVQHYERITRRLMAQAPALADVTVRLDASRRPLEVRERGG